jgi:CDP-4-dehydro-6-deoxyglucose reductase
MIYPLLRDTTTTVHLIFGTRFANGILYQKEWETLMQQYPNFRFSVALSREDTPATTRGYVHAVYTQCFDATAHYYLCGWQNMVDEATAQLKNLGLPAAQLHYELYG